MIFFKLTLTCSMLKWNFLETFSYSYIIWQYQPLLALNLNLFLNSACHYEERRTFYTSRILSSYVIVAKFIFIIND
jgi:hypothetical protein